MVKNDRLHPARRVRVAAAAAAAAAGAAAPQHVLQSPRPGKQEVTVRSRLKCFEVCSHHSHSHIVSSIRSFEI